MSTEIVDSPLVAAGDPIAERARPRPRVRALLRVLLFPWLVWYLTALPPRLLRERFLRRSRTWKLATYLLQGGLYLTIGLPLTVVLLGELLITANELVLSEQANYRLQSDWKVSSPVERLVIPRPATPNLRPVPAGDTEAYRQYLVQLFSPVVFQKVSDHPEWDIPLLLDFDGNLDPRDNVVNEKLARPHVAGVYGELTAETADSYYLTYSLYHVKDYDHPVREAISRWTYHDNDNEGFHLRVDKETMEVVEAETWFHNRFLLFNRTGVSRGTEPVHGKMHFENGTHILIYAQPQGHGVRCVQLLDAPDLDHDVKILRFRAGRPVVRVAVHHRFQDDGTYELRNFDDWYRLALGPLGSEGKGEGIFEEAIPLGHGPDGSPREIGRFIAGLDYDINGWSRPKPMWSWDDGWDEIPILVWHFFPSYSFQSHGGVELSHDYLYNRPCEKVFGEPPSAVLESLRLPLVLRGGDKWLPLEGRGGKIDRRDYWGAFQHLLKGYVNYLFHALG